MRKIFIYLVMFVFPFLTFGQDYLMSLGNNGQTITTCTGNFYDSGGPTLAYGNNENRTITFCPTAPGQLINIAFSSFNVQGSSTICQDYLDYWFAPTPGADGTGTRLCANLGAFNLASTSIDGCISFRFVSNDDGVTRAGWAGVISCSTAPACAQPTGLNVTGITATGANVSWTQPNGAAAATQWQIFVGPQGGPAPINNPTATPVSNPHTLTGLTGLTQYCVYVRAICSNGQGFSEWTGPQCFTTGVPPLGCNGIFTDSGGINGNYGPNENIITTICPENPGEIVQVTFTQFQTEVSWDRLYVYNGSTIAAPLIPSPNPGGSGPCNTVAGGWWGNQLQGQTVTSTSPDGCLTFRFCSDGSVQQAGWVANVACIQGPACANPSNITVSGITFNTAQVSWTENGAPPATQWEVVVVTPANGPAPSNAAAFGTLGTVTTNNPFTLTGLEGLTNYRVYVRANCASGNGSSFFNSSNAFNTPAAPLGCGVTFTDSGGPNGNYGNNENITYTICPPDNTQLVQVTFNQFNTEANWDRLYVYNSNGIDPAAQITTIPGVVDVPNGGGFGAGCNTVTGGFWGTQLQGQTIIATNNTGCLTFRFCSDGSVTFAGWSASVVCIPAPGCLAPSGLTVSNITTNSANISWSDNGVPPSTQWEYILQPANLPAPSNAAVVNPANIVTSNTQQANNLVNCQLYRFYVRAICANGNGNSFWTASPAFGTPAVNDNCQNAITVPVNTNASCAASVPGCLTGATASPQPNACPGTANDDVWFSFTATGASHIISLLNIVGSTNDLAFGVYSGTCAGLVQVQCSAANSGVINGLTAGTTYFIRVYTEPATPGQSVNFEICVGTIPSCSEAEPFCTDTGVTFNNSTGVPSLGQIGCLFTTPNPAWFFMEIGTSGDLHLNIAQTNAGGGGLDVDYVAWGPFNSNAEACAVIPNNPLPGNLGQPLPPTQLHACSYSIAPVEYMYLPNVIAGQIYVVLITNFSNQPGTITFNQIGGTASTNCSIVCPLVDLGQDIVLCDATQHTITATTTTAPDSYEWYDINNVLIPGAITNQLIVTVSGTYRCVVKKVGCPDEEDQIVVTFNTSVTPIFDAVGPFCAGDSIAQLPTTSTNGINGTWTPAINNASTTTYTFTPNQGECATTQTLTITVNNCNFSAYASAVWIDDCTNQANLDGEFYNISGSGIDLINQTPDRDFNNRNYGTFSTGSSELWLRGAEVKTIKNIASSNVCTPKLFYRVYQTGLPTGVFQPVGGWDIAFRANCDTGLGQFPFGNVPCNNAGQQLWQCVTQPECNPSVDLTQLPAGNYTLEVYFEVPGSTTTTDQCNDLFLINNGGSNYTATFTIVDPGQNGSLTLCEGTIPTNDELFAALNGTPSTGGTWSGPINNVYTYTLDIAPCPIVSSTVTITYIPQANAGTNGTLTVCSVPTEAELFAALGGNPSTGGTWSGPVNNVYTYTVLGTSPCPNATATVTVSSLNVPVIDLGPDQTICDGDSVTLTAPDGFTNYLWSNGETTQSITVSQGGTYTVTGLIVLPSPINLVINPGFENGLNSYTSSYTVGNGGAFGLVSNGNTYAIVNNPNSAHVHNVSCPLDGNMFVANGGNAGNNANVVCQSINVEPNTNYIFSVDAINPHLNAGFGTLPLTLQMLINGNNVGSITPPMEPNNCDWQTYTSSVWNSGTNTSVIICIQNSTPVASLLAIDNLRFSPFVTCEESDSVTITIVDQANAGTDGTLEFCDGQTPTDAQLFAALGGTPDTGGTWTGPVNNVYTYTVSGTVPCPDDSSTVTILPIVVSNPIITTTPATCSAAGTATISNFDANITYIFNPTGPTVDANGDIAGLTCGINYTVTASNGSCDSAAVPFGVACPLPTPNVPTVTITPATCSAAGMASFTNFDVAVTYTFDPSGPTVDATGNISGLTCGQAYTVTATLGACISAPSTAFTIGCQLLIPIDPIVTTTPATCSAAGSALLTNFDANITYIFNPTGPTVDANGDITGLTCDINYTVTASNGSCDSAAVPFSVACPLPTPNVPLVSTTPATCNAAGSAVITNVEAGVTYTFVPAGPTVDALGNISNFDCGTSYTVTAVIGNCTSAPSSAFTIDCQLLIPFDPIVTTTPATCSAAGGATISNFDANITYIFNPIGPTVDANGGIAGLTCGINYTVTASNGSCDSAAVPFGVACPLPTPNVPTVTITPATCSAAGMASFTNFDVAVTYTFDPSGPTVDALGNISNFDCGTAYTVTATLGNCTSAPSIAFTIDCQLLIPIDPIVTTTPATCSAAGGATISNFDANITYIFNPTGPSVDSTGNILGLTCGINYSVTASNGSCSSAAVPFGVACQLPTPDVPLVSTTPATCNAAGMASFTNFDVAVTYTFDPSGPTVDATGNISGLTCGQAYTVTATLGTCISAPSAAFTIGCQLLTPVNPIVSTTPATCSGAGTATISNFVVGNTYIFNPTGPTVGANGIITGLSCGTITYTVTANNGSCSSSAIQFSVACQLPSTETPTIVYTAADCFNQEAATISNYNQALSYTFTPSSGSSTPSIGANGVISGLDCNVSYTLVASNGQCPSAAVTIDVECIVTNACQIPRGISPNGDGLNDVWDIEFLNAKRVEIFNRYGMIVYSRDNYRKEWGGLSNDGQQLSDGTYFYVITLENENKSGWVYINRERR